MSGWISESSTARPGMAWRLMVGWLVLPTALPLVALLVADQLTK